MHRSPIYVVFSMLVISLFSSSASATLVRIDFYTEMTRTFTASGSEFFDRTSATGVIFYEDATGAFPSGNPVIHLNNERFVDGVDSTADMLAIDPSLGPQDWVVGLDEISINSTGGVVSAFAVEVFWIGNDDPVLGTFNNPLFKNFAGSGASSPIDSIYIESPSVGATWTNSSGGLPITTAVNWSYTVVPVPAAVWLFGSGLLGLVGMAKRKKAA